MASTQRFKGLGWPRRQRSFNLVNLGGLERVNLSGRGAAGGGRRPTSFFLGFGCKNGNIRFIVNWTFGRKQTIYPMTILLHSFVICLRIS